MNEGLSVKDIRTIGAGRCGRKFDKSPVAWLLMLMAWALLISSLVVMFSSIDNPQYTLPSGEIVELDGGTLIIEDTIIAERDNPVPFWTSGVVLMVVAACFFLGLLVYILVQEGRAKDRILEEWLEAGYQPKAKDV